MVVDVGAVEDEDVISLGVDAGVVEDEDVISLVVDVVISLIVEGDTFEVMDSAIVLLVA